MCEFYLSGLYCYIVYPSGKVYRMTFKDFYNGVMDFLG